MQTFCTIVTPEFIPFAKVLHNSLVGFKPDLTIQVLVIGETSLQPEKNFTIHTVDELKNYSLVKQLAEKYAYTNKDQFRWALKPVFLSHLLEQYDKVIYVDADIYFFSDPSFLFKELDNTSVLLSPHWGETNPTLDEEKFLMNFRIGLYNAGFIGASKKGLPSLEWWATACSYEIKQDNEKGLYDDQRYLDLFPIIDPDTKILRHKGCNVGSWNINTCKRLLKNGNVFISEEFPIVFIHFNYETIRHILNGNDNLLLPYYIEYEKAFNQLGQPLNEFVEKLSEWKKKNFFLSMKRKTKIRSRIKKWLYKLSTK
ncbi:MAG: hypothetical protein ABIP79_08520 [Chitinophagaceae bacterium]